MPGFDPGIKDGWMKKGFAGVFLLSLLSGAALGSGDYYTNASITDPNEHGAGFFIMDEGLVDGGGSRIPVSIDRSTTLISADSIDFITGKIRYQISPNLSGDVGAEDAYCAFKYAYQEDEVSTNPVLTHGEDIFGSSQDSVYFWGEGVYPEYPLATEVKLLSDCSIRTQSSNGAVSTNSSNIRSVYTFKFPASSGGGAASSFCRGGDFACIAETYELDNSDFFTPQVIQIDVPGDFHVKGGTPRGTDGPIFFSSRLWMQQALECPYRLRNDSGGIDWKIFKYNGSAGWGEVSSSNLDGRDSQYYNSIYETGDQHYVLHDTLLDTVDEGVFNDITPSYIEDYLEYDRLNDTVCEKLVCPKYFVSYPAEQIHTNPELSNLCHKRVPRIKINPIPKRIFVQYPNGGEAEVYEVPDLGEYFSPGNLNNPLVYEVVEVGGGLSVSIDADNPSKLLISSVVTPALEADMQNNTRYGSYFVIRAKETMTSQHPGDYDFPNRELAVELRIDVDILSSIYDASRKELYRCQALTK